MSTEVLGSTATTAPAAWIPDDSTFGARLALIRQRMGWGNVKEAATACRLPTESWRTWERDGVEPRGLQRIATQISNATGCDLIWLMGGPQLRRPGGIGTELVFWPNSDRPKDNRPSGHAERRTPLAQSTERASTRRPQRVGSVTHPMSRRSA